MTTLDSAFDISGFVVKVSGAALLNYVSLLLVQLTDSWSGQAGAAPFVDISAGVAFVTILLLGLTGAIATLIALLTQYVQIDGTYGLTFVVYALSCVILQYTVIKLCLIAFGLDSALQGLTHLQLLVISAIFSVIYTLSDTFILQQLHQFETRPVAQQAVGDFLGIITCFLLLKLVVLLRKRFFDSAA